MGNRLAGGWLSELEKAMAGRSAKRTERLQVMLEPDELKALDDWRFGNRLPTRAAAVRELLRRGLSLGDKQDVEAVPSTSGSWSVVERNDKQSG